MSTYRDDNEQVVSPDEQHWSAEGQGAPGGDTHWPTEGQSQPRAEHPSAHDTEPRTLPRPKGPSWSTIALGLVCLVVAGGALLVEFTELSVRWDRTGPLALVGLGILLVLVGFAALMRRGDDQEDDDLDR